ncbi:uncharacterized protein LOC120779618 [Bactrocera tryoni]|uniref:uncharacterized protein LOC120779618 n=1 Tax=Bactrocera tryoni TaxID=59916 RepID=UPI001A96F0B9|nr:uncharacterized protein LOC120779618 [Bactrocera tryoni]
MEKNPDILTGFTKRNKPTIDSLWQALTESLNAAGPPHKDVNGWKKVITEWKSEIKRKLAHNKIESRATGGGPFSKYQLTPNEETIVRLCGISQTIEGILGVSLGTQPVNENLNIPIAGVNVDLSSSSPEEQNINLSYNASNRQKDTDDIPSTSQRQHEINASVPRRQKLESTADRLKRFLDEEDNKNGDILKKFDQIIELQSKNASSLRRIYQAIGSNNKTVGRAITELKDEFVSISTQLLKAIVKKNESKKEQLNLEVLKFEHKRQYNEKKD